ncbi:MAG: hypothetical protein ACUZ8H_10790 [Candidatus Anammoxibacter sp.]
MLRFFMCVMMLTTYILIRYGLTWPVTLFDAYKEEIEIVCIYLAITVNQEM